DALVEKYGDKAKKQNRSINVDFGVKADADDNTDYRVISVDVVPAFDKDADFEIPDNDLGKWIKTNPQTHAEKATAA
ncbi:SMODS domain-containing nucleotidyltransferase, partial [Escherichia coli]|uniref:SMODS domain-containing nucleotidyltransferase n=2 Tax=Pseudomonadota TaxID=1224 RepID=UPI003F2857F5